MLHEYSKKYSWFCSLAKPIVKKVNKKVQGVSQAAANPWHQEGEKKDKNQPVQNKQTKAWEANRQALSAPSEVITMLKGLKKHEDKE